MTGLWTAYHAAVRDPDRSIVVAEAETVGYGASSRNGGWLSDLLPGNRTVWERTAGPDAVRAMQRAVTASVDDVLAVCAAEGIDAGQRHAGRLSVARTPAALGRLRSRAATDARLGARSSLLDARQVRDRVAVAGAVGGLAGPDAATLDPRALVSGLAEACRRRGVEILEHHRVTDLRTLEADRVAVCTEAYGGPLVGVRSVVPVNSSIVLTRRLPPAAWDRIGWDSEALNDAAHVFVYLRRTADGRIAIGGRGSPYRFGSGVGDGTVDARTVRSLTSRLRAFFPGVPLEVDRSWSGVIGVTRDWCATVRPLAGPVRAVAAYGYAGHGVTATHLAARTLLDRLDGRRTDLTALPWNVHDPGRWEPEPVRWLGIHGMYAAFRLADAWEEARGARRTSLLARAGARLAGLEV